MIIKKTLSSQRKKQKINSHRFTGINTDLFVFSFNAKHETQNTKHLRPTAAPFENKGFTLIEMIVALLIFGLLSTLLFSTLIRIQRRTSTSQWKNELTEEGVKICNIIRLELTGAREILYAGEDSISFLNQEGEFLSFYVKDSLLFKSKKKLNSGKTKLSSFKFTYYPSNDIIGEPADPIYSLPLDAINLQRVTVIDWKIGLKREITSVHLKTGIFTRNIRQQ